MINLLPIATTIVAVLLSIESFHLGGYAGLTPAFTLMVTFHWTIYRPDLLPALFLFMIGAIQDLLSGGLPGMGAITLLLVREVVFSHRRYYADRQFPLVWAGFTLLIGGVTLLSWVLHSLLAGQLLDLRGPVFSAVLTVATFPAVSFLLGRGQRAMLGAE